MAKPIVYFALLKDYQMDSQQQKNRNKQKDEKLRALQTSAAETIIQGAVASGMKIKSAMSEDKIELEFTQNNDKKITIYVRYEDFAAGGNRIVSLVKTLDQRNK